MELATALSYCASLSVPEKKEGLKALFVIINNDKHLTAMDVKKIVERLNPLINEGAHKANNFQYCLKISFSWFLFQIIKSLVERSCH